MNWFVTTTLLLLSCCMCQACDEGSPCNSTSVDKGICIRGTCRETIPNWARENLTFTITVRYPELSLSMQGGSNLYLRGNGLGLSWAKGELLKRISGNTWSFKVVYESSVGGYSCQTCADRTHLIHRKLDYRVLVDDRLDMVGANFAVDLPVSKVSSYFTSEKEFVAYPWFYKKEGNITAVVVASPELGGNRSIALYTPPSFHENTYKTYPVIYALDFDLVKLPKQLLDDLIVKYGATEEFIVIGFGNYTSQERFDFLAPTRHPVIWCKNGTFSDRCGDCFTETTEKNYPEYLHTMITKCGKLVPKGGKGDDTLDFLLNTALPAIQNTCDNRLSTERENIGIMGYSLGGLMSCHAAWTRPQQFGFAACQSSSFWWPTKVINTTLTAEFEIFTKTMQNETLNASRPPQRIYIDVGGVEDVAPYMMAMAAVEAADKITKINGYKLDKNVWVNVFPLADHTFLEWKLRLWKALTTLLPAQGSPQMPTVSSPPLVGK